MESKGRVTWKGWDEKKGTVPKGGAWLRQVRCQWPWSIWDTDGWV